MGVGGPFIPMYSISYTNKQAIIIFLYKKSDLIDEYKTNSI